MPLRKADLRLVTIKRRLSPGALADDEAPMFAEDGVCIAAAIQPLRGHVQATIYGEETARMLLLLTESRAAIEEGMGVCVYGGACDYFVAEPPERWRGHTRAVLRRL